MSQNKSAEGLVIACNHRSPRGEQTDKQFGSVVSQYFIPQLSLCSFSAMRSYARAANCLILIALRQPNGCRSGKERSRNEGAEACVAPHPVRVQLSHHGHAVFSRG